MKPGPRNLLGLIGILLALSVVMWFLMPRIVDALPGQIRVRLPEEFLELVTTPLPTALPAPLRTISDTNVAGIALATSTPTRTATPTDLPRPEPTVGPASTRRPPTPTPLPPPSPSPTPSPTPLPGVIRLEGLEVTPQKYNNCGPANLSIVLNYYGHQVNQLEIGEALKPNYEDRNVSPDELAAYVTSETELQSDILYGLNLTVLKQLLAAGFPVIVEKGLLLEASHGWMGHYLTLYGYDDKEEVLYGLDTFLGPWDSTGRSFDFASLDELWAQFNRATIVVYPQERATELALVLGPDMLDEKTMWMAAADSARLAIEQDPSDAFAWLDLGASLYHLAVVESDSALFEQSAAAFDQAREIGLPWRTLWYQFEPYLAYIGAGRFDEVLALTDAVLTTSGGRNIEETYLYRGHALLASGDSESAGKAYERALRLNPGLDQAREALQALSDQSSVSD